MDLGWDAAKLTAFLQVERFFENQSTFNLLNVADHEVRDRLETNKTDLCFLLRGGWFGYRLSVIKRLVNFAARPKPMQQDGKFSRHRDGCSFLGVLPATLAEFHSRFSRNSVGRESIVLQIVPAYPSSVRIPSS